MYYKAAWLFICYFETFPLWTALSKIYLVCYEEHYLIVTTYLCFSPQLINHWCKEYVTILRPFLVQFYHFQLVGFFMFNWESPSLIVQCVTSASIRTNVIEEVDMELDVINLIISITKFLIMIGLLQNVGVLLCKSKITMNSLNWFWQVNYVLANHTKVEDTQANLKTTKEITNCAVCSVILAFPWLDNIP